MSAAPRAAKKALTGCDALVLASAWLEELKVGVAGSKARWAVHRHRVLEDAKGGELAPRRQVHVEKAKVAVRGVNHGLKGEAGDGNAP